VFKDLPERKWKHLSEMWIANMHTILLNWDFRPDLRDLSLLKAIQTYKVWFLKFILQSDKNYSTFGKALKTIANWMQWCALDCPENEVPRSIAFFKLWSHRWARPIFPWFGGHLSSYRDIAIRCGRTSLKAFPFIPNNAISDREVTILCQMRTFGRALPVPTPDVCVESIKEVISVLTTEKAFNKDLDRAIRIYITEKYTRMGIDTMPQDTHLSLRQSGEYSCTQQDGGQAESIRVMLTPFQQKWESLYVESHPDLPFRQFSDVLEDEDPDGSFEGLFDPFGQLMVDSSINLWGKDITIFDGLYCTSAIRKGQKLASKVLNQELSNRQAGKVILLAAVCDSLSYGRFEPEPHGYIRIKNWNTRIPYWTAPVETIYIVERGPLARLTSLAEPGFKARSLSINEAWLQIIFSTIRFPIESVAARDARARIGLAFTNKLWNFLKYLERIPAYKVFFGQSTDFKSATDHISLWVIKALWEPKCQLVPKTAPMSVYQKLIWAPRTLEVSGEFRKKISPDLDLTHRCGSFMGEPLSFISLTDINLFIEDMSGFFYYYNHSILDWGIPIDNRCVIISNPCAITGDDVAAIRFHLERSRLHRQVARDSGMILSSGKDGDSTRVLIFCEDHILINCKDSQNGERKRLQFVDVIKSRLLTTMSRNHADGRAAIFGKGRMLGQQLAWYSNPMIRLISLEIFFEIFEKKYLNVFRAWMLPYFLPPNCGGLGIPISKIPSWGYKYINYIMSIQSDWKEFVSFIWRCRHLTSRNSWGWDDHPRAINLAITELAGLKRSLEPIEPKNTTRIYSLDQVASILREDGFVIPLDPYTQGPDFEQVKVFAVSHGYIELDQLVDQYERVLAFQEALSNKITRCDKTLVLWSRRSARFWGKIRPKDSNERPVDMGKLEKQATEALSGFIYRERMAEVIKYGPTLNLRIEQRSLLHSPMGTKRTIGSRNW